MLNLWCVRTGKYWQSSILMTRGEWIDYRPRLVEEREKGIVIGWDMFPRDDTTEVMVIVTNR